MMLQAMKKDILMLPETNSKQIIEKKAQLTTTNKEIDIALKIQKEA